jgi:undecaprenyl diphosphate synthase
MEEQKIPNHIAIIADGNRRWAKQRGLPTMEGHRKGAETTKKLVRKAKKLGIKIMTFWVFSTENWKRTKDEVGYLMRLFEEMIVTQIKEALEEETRIVHLGRKDRLPEGLRNKINEAEEKTKHFTEHYFVLALDYGGRDEILRAVKKISEKGNSPHFTEEEMNNNLDTSVLPYPEPDLVIRTSGEERMSGFMSWQAAYSEYYFSPLLFPDFDEAALESAVRDYSERKRRFGK